MGASFQDRASRAAHGALSGLRHPATIACAYVAMAIFSFGHAAAHKYQQETEELARCHLNDSDPKNFCFDMRAADATFSGVGAGFIWPFYWSWELQQ